MQNNKKEMDQKRLARCICLILLSILIYIGYHLGQIAYIYLFDKYDVILDAGHGGYDGGAVSGDTVEKDITLELCLKVKEMPKYL